MLIPALESREALFAAAGCPSLDAYSKDTGDRRPRYLFACDEAAEVLARVLLPEIQAFFKSGEGQREFAEWKAQQQAEQQKQA